MPDSPSDTAPRPEVTRRAVVAGAGAVAIAAGLVVAGCSGPFADGSPGGSGDPSGKSGDALGPAGDVPVGSAKIYSGEGVVVTQADAGTYAGFSTVCPHQGCTVNEVEGAMIVCPCHGSEFALDGSVVSGPAPRGLTPKAVTVTGGRLTLS